MLQSRRDELRQRRIDDARRLDRIEVLLRQLGQEVSMHQSDVVMKHIEPLRVAAVAALRVASVPSGCVPQRGRHSPSLGRALTEQGVDTTGSLLLFYEGDPESDTLSVYAAAPIGDQNVTAAGSVRVMELPAIDAATIVSRGAVSDSAACCALLAQAVEAKGCVLDGHGRDVLIEIPVDDPERRVVELQLPMRPPARPIRP